MNREIKFRGKRADNGKWVHGSYVKKLNPVSEDGLPIKHYIADLAPFGFIVDIETLGQFTGLKDKNGVEIYEGDILQNVQTNKIGFVSYRRSGYMLLDNEFEDFDFLANWCTQTYIDGKEIYYALVIGNIHENKEILSDKQSKEYEKEYWHSSV